MAGLPEVAVDLALLRVLDRDVRRVADDNVILPTEQEWAASGSSMAKTAGARTAFCTVFVATFRPGGSNLAPRIKLSPIARLRRPPWCTVDIGPLASVHRRDDQAESRDGHGVGVDVDPA